MKMGMVDLHPMQPRNQLLHITTGIRRSAMHCPFALQSKNHVIWAVARRVIEEYDDFEPKYILYSKAGMGGVVL